MQLLTEDDKHAILKEWDSNLLLDLMADVEAKIMEKIGEPVAYARFGDDGFLSGMFHGNCSDKSRTPLYKLPDGVRAGSMFNNALAQRITETGMTGEPGNWNGAKPVVEALEALRKDAERLDWLLAHNDATVCNEGAYGPFFVLFRYSGRITNSFPTAKAAIDAARGVK